MERAPVELCLPVKASLRESSRMAVMKTSNWYGTKG